MFRKLKLFSQRTHFFYQTCNKSSSSNNKTSIEEMRDNDSIVDDEIKKNEEEEEQQQRSVTRRMWRKVRRAKIVYRRSTPHWYTTRIWCTYSRFSISFHFVSFLFILHLLHSSLFFWLLPRVHQHHHHLVLLHLQYATVAVSCSILKTLLYCSSDIVVEVFPNVRLLLARSVSPSFQSTPSHIFSIARMESNRKFICINTYCLPA